MGLDEYKVDVVHYINPHLIWVLVRKEEQENSFHFEQIGIYGILPQNITFGIDCVIKPERCEQWMPAASLAVRKCLLDADEVWFSPTYIDKKSSIFDDNTHKYGDLKIIKKGKQINMLDEILNSEFAFEDECLFHQELTGNNLKTQLNYIATHEVMTKIAEGYKTRNIPKNIWLNTLKDQMSVYLELKNIESSIQTRKVDANDCDDIESLLKNKLNFLKFCKDVDEESVGRACGPRKSAPTGIASTALRKKLEWLESQSIYKQAKEDNAIPKNVKADVDSKPAIIAPNEKTNAGLQAVHSVETNGAFTDKENNNAGTKNKNLLAKDTNNADIKKGKKPRKIDSDAKLVAFGPAGLQTNKFNPKTPTEEKEEPVKEVTRKPEPEVEYDVKKEEDVYANVDSEVNLKITNLEALKQIKAINFTQETNKTASKVRSKAAALSAMKRKMKFLDELHLKANDSLSSVSDKDSSKYELDSDNESLTVLQEQLGLSNNRIKKNVESETVADIDDVKKSNVNPFKNVDGSISIFVDTLVSPVLMVHTKMDVRIEPVSNMRDIPFGNDIHTVLRNMGVQKPMRPQTVSWPTILRGHSFFLIGPYNSGSTMGYLPAVCRLVYDFKNTPDKFGLSCIIVCATSHAVSSVEAQCKMFLHSAKIFACHVGMSDVHITTSLLNGCDLLICSLTMLVRLIQEDFSLDFRNLTTFVVDDCEHISTIYPKELKFVLLKVMDIVKNRAHKEWKVQYIIVSRVWCDFMSSLARKAPDSVVCISAFEECVLYSKAATSVEFVAQENKVASVVNFMNSIDKSKKTVIVCKADDEVKLLERALTQLNYVVFSCDSTMTVQDLYNLDKTLKDYDEPVSGPILLCCDGNLTHLNVTDAHYLVHYSLPDLFSMFCKRFATLIDNYPSIFKQEDSDIKIKILFDNNNIEQLPKILHFIKRCTEEVPPFLDEISSSVLTRKFLNKAQNLVPICRRLLTLGKCPDFWNCIERHAIFKEFDSPKSWLPKEGVITFQILHYHSAVSYAARLSSCTVKGNITKYPQTNNSLSFKMARYYSKEENRKLHGLPKIGDVCAVTLKQNHFSRCQVTKVMKSEKNRPTFLLIKLLDEEIYEIARDTSLYYLPDDFKNIETHVVTVILANLTPQDKDVTFSKLAENQLKRITDENADELYMRGQIAMVVGNFILVHTLEACQYLSSLNEINVKCNFREELLDGHAIPNPDHINNLRKVCDFTSEIPEVEQPIEITKPTNNPIKVLPKSRWAHLESGEFSSVFFIHAENPCQFFVRPAKYDKCLTTLINDIKKYITANPEPVKDINLKDIVLAEFPDDATYERARIDNILDNNMVKCFFVDQGEWRDVSVKKICPITEKFVTQLPFQAIECRLVGIRPLGNNWTDFSTNFFVDSCFDSVDKLKQLFIKYFTKEKAEFTEGHKYGVVLIDTYSSEDVIINQEMVDRNLAEENDEIELLDDLGFERKSEESFDSDIENEPSQTVGKIDRGLLVDNKNLQVPNVPSSRSDNLLRSMPLVDSDNSSDEFDLIADDSGKISSIPISEIVSITELPDTEWNEKVLASSIDVSMLPAKVNPKLDVSTESNDQGRTPKILWRQNKNTVTIKIELIVHDYKILIKERHIKFSANADDINYEFDFELYGVVNLKKCCHCNKGQYIQVKLWKLMAKNWLTLTRDNGLKKWIVYDIDGIDVSSDEESVISNRPKHLVNNADSDSDDNLQDDISFSY